MNERNVRTKMKILRLKRLLEQYEERQLPDFYRYRRSIEGGIDLLGVGSDEGRLDAVYDGVWTVLNELTKYAREAKLDELFDVLSRAKEQVDQLLDKLPGGPGIMKKLRDD